MEDFLEKEKVLKISFSKYIYIYMKLMQLNIKTDEQLWVFWLLRQMCIYVCMYICMYM